MKSKKRNKDGKKSLNPIEAIKWMYAFGKNHRKWLLLGLLSTFSLILANMLKAHYTQEIINTALGGGFNKLITIALIFTIVMVIAVLSQYISKYATEKYALYSTRNIKERLSTHITQATIGSTQKTQSGDLATRLNSDTEHVTSFMKNDFNNVVIQPLMGIVAIAYVLYLSWKLSLVSLIVTPLLIFLMSTLSKKLGKLFPDSYNTLGEASGVIEEAMTGIDIIKAYNLEDATHKKCKEKYKRNYAIELRIQKYIALIQPVGLTSAWLPRMICALYGGYLVLNGELKIGTVVAVLQLFEYIVIFTTGLPFTLTNVRQSIGAIERIEEIFNLPTEDTKGILINEKSNDIALKLKNVSFGYNPTEKIIKDVGFELAQNNMIALVGPSGCGKSTIIDLICGLYDYDGGEIEVFGRSLRDLKIQSVREKIGVVSQDTFLFPGTIAENIMYGRKGASLDEIVEAAKSAQAHDFISDLPEGYDTVLGEGGINLSGGQRQRLSIARAFLKDAPILLLDEPTASLDNYSEALMQRSLENLIKDRAVLVIAHRLSTITKANKIILLKDGHIMETGTHHELLEKREHYYQLYNNQGLQENQGEKEELKYA